MLTPLKKIALVATGLCPWILLAAPNSPESHPNVLLIVVDDLGWRDLSVQGSDFYETPAIDQLAKEGARFTQAYASCQVCSPSRASLMTGRYPARMKTTDWFGAQAGENWKRNTALLPAVYKDYLDPAYTTVAEAFKEAGYKTFFAGKWHLGKEEMYWPEYQGYDINRGGHDKGTPPGGFFAPHNNPRLENGPDGEALPIRLAQETASFIKEQGPEPFFATLAFYTVHAPAETTRELWDKYRRKALAQGTPERRMDVERRRPIRITQDNPIYGGMVETMDEAVGIVLEALKAKGVYENTLVIFTSDHGGVASGDHWATSNLPLRGGKGYQWEGGLRVPLIVSLPKAIRPVVIEETPVIGTDLFPTMLALAGLPLKPEDHLDGVSLAPLFAGEALAPRPLFWHYPHYGNQGGDPSSVVRLGDWKLIHYHETGADELYNLKDDLSESTDLAPRHPAKAKELRALLDAWFVDVEADFPSPNPHFKQEAYAQSMVEKVEVELPRREQQAAQILEANWQPDPTWWGSEPVVD